MKTPSMTRQHYDFIADLLAHAPVAGEGDLLPAAGTRRVLAEYVAASLRGTNPRFDEARFIKAAMQGVD